MFKPLTEQQRSMLQTVTEEQSRTFFKWVYGWMTGGLVVTTIVAYLTTNTSVMQTLMTSPLILIGVFIAQIVLVIALAAMINKMSPPVAAMTFLGYSALTGLTLSLIVYSYTAGTVTAAFVTTAALFGVMTVVGFTTKADLTKFRTLAMFALIGLLIAMVVNIFLASPALNFLISFIGVILFIGLLAMDTQRLKLMAAAPEIQSDRTVAARMAILGALTLYLDVINLFLFLLRLLGGGRR
ncbi:MAG TPA: Bax inhibitor-1/YccA family protein [Candidatus Limnocylindrales bacterium]|nr:Bax inhibitor-1/YccA family protein [Candidatus Limnocylindrales bacterium]